MDYQERLSLTQKKLDTVSPTFCLAKWLQVSLHLERGLSHSCHHPRPEPIPEGNLSLNPSSLHNTPEKLNQRLSMLKGEKPQACSYCWKLESLPASDTISDRVVKSSSWLDLETKDLLQVPLNQVTPRYVEVSFSNKCNLKCSYCSSLYSSAWSQEHEAFGGGMPHVYTWPRVQLAESENPYIEAFWKWWPELKLQLETLRITGGEPLLSDSLWRILDELENNPNKNISLIINSNLMVGSAQIEKLSEKLRNLLSAKHVRSIKIVTSLESDGAAAEYSRFGLKTDIFWKNVDLLLKSVPDLQISITSTIQILAVTTYLDFLKNVLSRRKDSQFVRLMTDPIFLKEPPFLSIEFLPDSVKKDFSQKLSDFVSSQNEKWSAYEKMRLGNFIRFLSQSADPITIESSRIKVKDYFREYDRRRKLSFSKTFPELKDYYELS